MKKNYYIKTDINVYLDDFHEGEQQDCINYWQAKSFINANTPMEAIKQFFENTLYWSFEEEYAHIDALLNGVNCLQYSNYVDKDNAEVAIDSEDMIKFKRAEIQLFVANTYLEIYEVIPVKI